MLSCERSELDGRESCERSEGNEDIIRKEKVRIGKCAERECKKKVTTH